MRKAIAMFFVLLCATAAFGQFADASSAGGPVTITAPWRFHTGDDPAWASPDFDDSQWPLLRLDKSWADQGYKGYSGYAWYRIRVKLPPRKNRWRWPWAALPMQTKSTPTENLSTQADRCALRRFGGMPGTHSRTFRSRRVRGGKPSNLRFAYGKRPWKLPLQIPASRLFPCSAPRRT